jgi:hypothetical protein
LLVFANGEYFCALTIGQITNDQMANDQMAIGQLAKYQMAIGQRAKDKRPNGLIGNGKWPNGKCQNENGMPKFLKVPKIASLLGLSKKIFRKSMKQHAFGIFM